MFHSFRVLALAGATLPSLFSQGQSRYNYESVPNDPLAARIYTLDNGLKVYLSRNEDAPRIYTQIAVRAGSKNDPAHATGLAHYLEHMLFKGTSQIGTTNWEVESKLLQEIATLFEIRRKYDDPQNRDSLYALIDQLSLQASQYALPNEYDKMVKSIGGRGTNAYTSHEQTVYLNEIPTGEIEKWMALEAERFRELVLRLFHTELEAVYEEFNISQDNDRSRAYHTLMGALFPSHPYGTQTTIGSGHHLKEPSMKLIHGFFDTWYVPNNMAIVMAGDLDYDATIAMVDRYFGPWKPRDLPNPTFPKEDPLAIETPVDIAGPMGAWVDVAWRIDASDPQNEVLADLVASMLSNGQAGLFDLELLQEQRVLEASAYANVLNESIVFGLRGKPRQGQTLEEVRDLMVAQVECLKGGEFENWLIGAVVNDQRRARIRELNDNNRGRAALMTSAFIAGKPWRSVVDYHDRMEKVTRQQVMEFANRHLGNGRVVVYKRTGQVGQVYKVPKPTITPIELNREAGQSPWHQTWTKIPSVAEQPIFVDFAKAIEARTLKSGVALHHVANPTNDLFSLHYVFDMGSLADPYITLALEYLPYLGTGKYPAKDFKQELYKLGLDLSVQVGEEQMRVTLSGLEKNMQKGVALLEHLLANAVPNAAAYKELVYDIGKQRQDGLRNKRTVLYEGLFTYARYGERNPLLNKPSLEVMYQMGQADIMARIHGLTQYQHRVFHYGRKGASEVAGILNKLHRINGPLREYPKQRNYVEQETEETMTYFVGHDMVQTDVLMVSKSVSFDAALMPFALLFNQYFGSGLSSIVFQEVRERRALAYGAFAEYTTPYSSAYAHYVRAFLGTQSDKLQEALKTMTELMNKMPMDKAQFQNARESALMSIASDRITKERIYWTWDRNRRLGLEHDIRKDHYAAIRGIEMEDLERFFTEQIAERNFAFLVMGKEGSVDLNVFEQFGPVRIMEKKELFGYGEE